MSMTALVSTNSTFLLNPTNDSHTPGILVNSRSGSSPCHHREPRQPSSFASSSSSTSQTSQSQSPSEGEGPSRKIRFAPLPAPRRDELPTVFYESDSDSPLPHSGSAPLHSYPQQPPSPRAQCISTLQQDDTPSRSKPRTWGQKILRPLLHPLLPSTTTNGVESYSALFRISSRDSTKGNADLSSEYKAGMPLARRMSTGSRAISSTKEAERSRIYQDGVPLTPVMSEGFFSKGRKDGQRMLNGRVYGRRLSASQNGTQASYEPEFVEWGYGGMGSVANNQLKSRSGPDWAKLQSNGKVLGGGADVDEDDDGSGMGWVKRRRAQREREEREREDRGNANTDHVVPHIAAHAPQSKEGKDYPRPLSHREESDQPRDSGEHHVYRAVSIPAPYHHHSRHHSLHKAGDGSGSATPTSLPALSRANSSSSVPIFRTASSGSHGEVLPTMLERKEDAEASSGSSETGSVSIDEEDDDDDDVDDGNDTERESDDDDRDDAEGRITSRCAGVEKISRHKE